MSPGPGGEIWGFIFCILLRVSSLRLDTPCIYCNLFFFSIKAWLLATYRWSLTVSMEIVYEFLFDP